MCGISGAIGFGREYLAHKDAFKCSQHHRGPDANGEWLHDQVHLIHNRLSIIDIEGGVQPLISENQQYAISYNGELYNYLEIKQELTSLGHTFFTTSDTEVVLKAYMQWNHECVLRFRGMFAFAIADLEQQFVFMARDHFGIKPLVYHQSEKGFYFASEIQAFKALKHLSFDLNYDALDEYFWLQYIPAPNSIFRQVKKLPPAHFMKVNFDGRINCLEKYWQFHFEPAHNKSAKEWEDEVEHTLRESVKSHLVSDVPFGAFLSGGIDSSLVVSYMSEIMENPVKTFSIGFKDQAFNELDYARTIARKYNTQHYEEVIEPDALDILPKLVKHYGEPFGDSSAIPTYYVSRLAGMHVKMVLSGDGGDEAFLGYDTYSKFIANQDYSNVSRIKRALYPLGRMLKPHAYFKRNEYTYWMEMVRYYPYEVRNKLYHHPQLQASHQHPLFKKLFNQPNDELVRKAQVTDLHTYLPSDILGKVDIASMANSLEVRTPLIDLKVWELIAKIPASVHVENNSGKQILKYILAKKVSTDFAFRKKQGFAVPLTSWFKNETNVRERVLDSDHLPTLFDMKNVNELVSEGLGKRIWLLLFLDEWLHQFHTKQ